MVMRPFHSSVVHSDKSSMPFIDLLEFNDGIFSCVHSRIFFISMENNFELLFRSNSRSNEENEKDLLDVFVTS